MRDVRPVPRLYQKFVYDLQLAFCFAGQQPSNCLEQDKPDAPEAATYSFGVTTTASTYFEGRQKVPPLDRQAAAYIKITTGRWLAHLRLVLSKQLATAFKKFVNLLFRYSKRY